MNNLKPIMKEKALGGTPKPNYKPGLLKKKPFGKTAAAPKVPNLMQRLTGK